MALNDLCSFDSERAIIGIMLNADLEIVNDIIARLSPAVFYEPKYELLYKIIAVLARKNVSADIVNLPEILRRKNMLETVGGIEELLYLVEGTATIANYEYFIQQLKEDYAKREYYKFAESLQNTVTPSADLDELFDISMAGLKKIYNLQIEDKLVTAAADCMDVATRKIEKLFDTGYKFIDARHTMEAGRFVLLAGKEKIGKTTLAINLIYNLLNQGKTVIFYSLEMHRRAIYDRLACIAANRSGKTTRIFDVENHREYYYKMLEPYNNLYVRDTRGGVDIDKIEREVRQIKPHAVFIDNSKLIQSSFRGQGLEPHFNYIATSLFTMAGDCNSCVFLVAHLNRAKLTKDDSKNDALYGGGSLQQSCDLALFIEKKEGEETEAVEQKVKLIITANRYGAAGECDLTINRSTSCIQQEYTPPVEQWYH